MAKRPNLVRAAAVASLHEDREVFAYSLAAEPSLPSAERNAELAGWLKRVSTSQKLARHKCKSCTTVQYALTSPNSSAVASDQTEPFCLVCGSGELEKVTGSESIPSKYAAKLLRSKKPRTPISSQHLSVLECKNCSTETILPQSVLATLEGNIHCQCCGQNLQVAISRTSILSNTFQNVPQLCTGEPMTDKTKKPIVLADAEDGDNDLDIDELVESELDDEEISAEDDGLGELGDTDDELEELSDGDEALDIEDLDSINDLATADGGDLFEDPPPPDPESLVTVDDPAGMDTAPSSNNGAGERLVQTGLSDLPVNDAPEESDVDTDLPAADGEVADADAVRLNSPDVTQTEVHVPDATATADSEEMDVLDVVDGDETAGPEENFGDKQAAPFTAEDADADETMDQENCTLIQMSDSKILALYKDQVVATLTKESAGNNADIFDTAPFHNAILSQAKTKGLREGLSPFGFTFAKLATPVRKQAAALVKTQVAAVKAEVAKERESMVRVQAEAMAIAATGMNRDYWKKFPNTLKAAFVRELSGMGISGAKTLVNRIFASHGLTHAESMLAVADILAKKSESARAELAENLDMTDNAEGADADEADEEENAEDLHQAPDEVGYEPSATARSRTIASPFYRAEPTAPNKGVLLSSKLSSVREKINLRFDV